MTLQKPVMPMMTSCCPGWVGEHCCPGRTASDPSLRVSWLPARLATCLLALSTNSPFPPSFLPFLLYADWVEKSGADLIPHLSTCMSPHIMEGSMIKNYYA